MKKYVVLVEEQYIRDAQVFTGTQQDACHCRFRDSDDWGDIIKPVYLGIYEGKSPQEAIKKAAAENILPEFILAAEHFLSEEEIYRKKQHEYRLLDAEAYLRDYIQAEGIDPLDVYADCDDAPEEPVTMDEMLSEDSPLYRLEHMVDKFEHMEDSNVAEADIWYEAARQLFC